MAEAENSNCSGQILKSFPEIGRICRTVWI